MLAGALENSSSSRKIIGGAFGFECPVLSNDAGRLPFAEERDQIQYFLNARCALTVFCDVRRPRVAWLPSYLCESLLHPFVRCRVPVRYYPVDLDLKVRDTEWVKELQPGDWVIAVHYFGFANSDFPAAQIVGSGALLLEDASQALFLPRQFDESTCIVYSPRKFLAVPELGVMVSRKEIGTEAVALAAPPDNWWKLAIATMQKRREFDLIGGNNEWFSLFQQVESQFPLGPYAASDLSKMLLTCGVDYGNIRTRRRENYFRLLEKLEKYALFPQIGPQTVPLGFPVLVDPGRRNRILQCLYEKGIYPPVHWRINGVVPSEFSASHAISNSMMTLICDQRYTVEDMDKQASEFLHMQQEG